MQHSVPANSPHVPRGGRASREAGRALRAGISLEMPRMGQESTWSQLVCRWRWPGRDQEIPGTLLQPRAALSSSSCPHSSPWPQAGLAALDAPGAWFSCKDWRQAPVVCQRPQCLPSAVPGCSQCSCVPGWLQRGGKGFPRGPRSCPSLSLGYWRAPAAPQPGPEQLHTQSSASKGGETSRGCCCP